MSDLQPQGDLPEGVEQEEEQKDVVIDPENPSGVGEGTVVKSLTKEDGWVEEKIVHDGDPDPETGVIPWHKEAGQ